MRRKEAIDQIEKMLKEHVSGSRGYIRQGNYKKDFFDLFAKTYSSDRLYADGIASELADRGIREGGEEFEVLRELRSMWDEWGYAWDHYPTET